MAGLAEGGEMEPRHFILACSQADRRSRRLIARLGRIAGAIDMLRQFLVGAAVSVCNIVIHALVMTAVVRVTHRRVRIHPARPITGARKTSRQSQRLIYVSVATISVLMAAHACEVIVWSLAYVIVGAAPAGADPVYFAFVNYTTLGYGDVTPVERWRLLGPMTAMNGVLMFGLSTAVIFEVLRSVVRSGGVEAGNDGSGANE